MKADLILKHSAYFFYHDINLIKDVPFQVEVDTLTLDEKKTLNQYIEAGQIISSLGLFDIEEVETKTTEGEVENEKEEKNDEVVSESQDTETPEIEVEQSVQPKPVAKKTVTRKSTKK